MSVPSDPNPAHPGWYTNPSGERAFWDGSRWTDPASAHHPPPEPEMPRPGTVNAAGTPGTGLRLVGALLSCVGVILFIATVSLRSDSDDGAAMFVLAVAAAVVPIGLGAITIGVGAVLEHAKRAADLLALAVDVPSPEPSTPPPVDYEHLRQAHPAVFDAVMDVVSRRLRDGWSVSAEAFDAACLRTEYGEKPNDAVWRALAARGDVI